MNVARILKDKGRRVVTAQLETKVWAIVQMLAEKKIGALVVTDQDGQVKGIMSERDIVRILAGFGPSVLEAPVSHYMTKDVMVCRECDTARWLMEEMTTHRFRHMPVVEGGKLSGIISIGDVVKLRVAECELEAASMREYIKTG